MISYLKCYIFPVCQRFEQPTNINEMDEEENN